MIATMAVTTLAMPESRSTASSSPTAAVGTRKGATLRSEVMTNNVVAVSRASDTSRMALLRCHSRERNRHSHASSVVTTTTESSSQPRTATMSVGSLMVVRSSKARTKVKPATSRVEIRPRRTASRLVKAMIWLPRRASMAERYSPCATLASPSFTRPLTSLPSARPLTLGMSWLMTRPMSRGELAPLATMASSTSARTSSSPSCSGR